MKIQIDTKEKTISILDDANIKELVKALRGMLGEDYEEYTIKKTETIVYTYNYPWYQWYPLTSPSWTTTTADTTVYNVEVMANC